MGNQTGFASVNGWLGQCADIAQLVEQLIRNQQVPGSSPGVGSKKIRHLQGGRESALCA